MARYAILFLALTVALCGCKRAKPEPEASPEEQRQAMENYARAKMPVLDHTMVMNDLDQIHLYLYTAYSSSGKWPKDMNAAKEQMARDPDMRKLLQRIEDGTYVIVGNPPDNGILAYCTKETTVGIIAVTTNKEFLQLKKDELDQKLQQQRR